MNERIKELIKQADDKCSETHGIFDEILAHVILNDVLECVEENRQKFFNNWIKNRSAYLAQYGAERIHKSIKERYGIE